MKRVKKNTNKISLKETIKNGIKKIKLAKMHIMIKHYDKQEAKYISKFEKHSKKFNDSVDKLHESLDKIAPDDTKKSKIPPVVDPKYAGPVPVKEDNITPFRFTVNGSNTSEGIIIRTPAVGISVYGRYAAGVKLIKTDDSVASIAKVRDQDPGSDSVQDTDQDTDEDEVIIENPESEEDETIY